MFLFSALAVCALTIGWATGGYQLGSAFFLCIAWGIGAVVLKAVRELFWNSLWPAAACVLVAVTILIIEFAHAT